MIPAKRYYRIMLGSKSVLAETCHQGGFIGGDWGIDVDLTGKLPDDARAFNREFIPVYLEGHPDKYKPAAGFIGSMLYTISRGIAVGDIVLCPNGSGGFHVGEVSGDYRYASEGPLPHRRPVTWYPALIERDEMSAALRKSAGWRGTVMDITKHAEEIEALLAGNAPPSLVATDPDVEDPDSFALESHLEDFLVHNWAATELGARYDIYEIDGELVGQQYPSDTGPIDILAISKDKKELLVVELKKGRTSDVVVGQIHRYMGYVAEELAENGQSVRGAIIAMEGGLRLRRALQVAANIDFYRYEVSFKLRKGDS